MKDLYTYEEANRICPTYEARITAISTIQGAEQVVKGLNIPPPIWLQTFYGNSSSSPAKRWRYSSGDVVDLGRFAKENQNDYICESKCSEKALIMMKDGRVASFEKNKKASVACVRTV